MTVPHIYTLIDMSVQINPDPPIGVHIEGTISKVNLDSPSSFSHSLTINEAHQAGRLLLDRYQDISEYLGEQQFSPEFLYPPHIAELLLVSFFFPAPDSLKSTRLRLMPSQMLAYGQELLSAADSADLLE